MNGDYGRLVWEEGSEGRGVDVTDGLPLLLSWKEVTVAEADEADEAASS